MPLFFTLPPIQVWSIKPTFDLRERFERRLDKDFSRTGSDNRSDLYSRWRIGANIGYGKNLTGKIVYQYAQDLFWTAAANGIKSNSDLLEANIELKTKEGKLKIGRQPFVKGRELLFGSSDWGNNGRSWNMVRWSDKRFDLFAGQLAVSSAPSDAVMIAGGSYTGKLGETTLVYKHDKRTAGEDDLYTIDHRWTKTKGAWNYDLEVAGQKGKVSSAPVEAWAGVAKATFQASPKAAIYGEIDIASGGHHGTTSHTFDQLFAGNHSKYGTMDVQGLRNMKGLTIGAAYKQSRATSFCFEYSRFGLYAANDAWYGDNGKAGLSDPSGAKGTDLGDEFDFTAAHKLSAKATIDGGLGIFRPGKFVHAFANKGDRNQVWGYVQLRFKF
jgi:hypothetical protein